MPEELDKMEVEDRRLEIRSEPVQEILTRVPSWIIRAGITVVFFILIAILVSTWFIKYPTIVSAPIVLTDQSPPSKLIARTSGKLDRLFVKENQYVKKGDYLAAIQSTARLDDILKLKSYLTLFKKVIDEPSVYSTISLDTNLVLGDLQNDHNAFLKAYFDVCVLYDNSYYKEKIDFIQNQLNNYYVLNEKLVYQKKILAEELAISQKLFDKDQTLFENNVYSESEYLSRQSGFLQKKYSFENITVSIINNTIQQSEYKKIILDLEQQEREAARSLLSNMRDAYYNLSSKLASWEQLYLLLAPIDGQVSFFKYWNENQYVDANDEMMYVVGQSSSTIGKIILPAVGSGKVKIGQKVRIKFDGYPYNEYGVVEGKVTLISQIARENKYAVTIELTNGLTTSYNKEILYRKEMQGVADIVTEDIRLFQRIFNQMRELLNNFSK